MIYFAIYGLLSILYHVIRILFLIVTSLHNRRVAQAKNLGHFFIDWESVRLKNGFILAKVVNKLHPSSIKYKDAENILVHKWDN